MVTATAYKSWAAVWIATVFAAQRVAQAHADGGIKTALGYAFSLMLWVGIVELGRPILAARLVTRDRSIGLRRPAVAFTIVTILLAINASSAHTAPALALMRRSPPTAPLIAILVFWALMIFWIARRGCSTTSTAVALAGSVVGTRLWVQWIWPFQRLDGDMLATIDRALSELAAGRFPYGLGPPPMPYLPETLLAYASPKALGLDVRYSNSAFDAATVIVTVFLARLVVAGAGRHGDAPSRTGLVLNQFLMPCLMLHPIWVHYGANTQFSPSLLFTTLLGFSVLLGGFATQAAALGAAVGSNQMLGACGPILFAYWAGRGGPARAVKLTMLSAAVFLLSLAPFLACHPWRLIEVAFLTRDHLPEAVMAGRLSLLPPVARMIPHAGPLATAVILVASAWAAYSRRTPSGAVAAMAGGLCGAMLFQPVSFAQYFLPAIVLASTVPPFDPGVAMVEHARRRRSAGCKAALPTALVSAGGVR